jgi:hypothetical protein
MQNWQVALLVVSAIFVGMWIPVSLQLIATLRSGQVFVKSMGSDLGKTLSDVSTTMTGLDKTIAELGEVARAAAKLENSIRVISSIGAAVGPGVVALVGALRGPGADTGHPGGNGASAGNGFQASAQKESTQ